MINRKYNSYLTDEYINKLSYDIYMAKKYTDTKKKKNLSEIMDTKLTKRQRECIIMYYVENKKMKDIALKLDMSTSTVSRTIERAKKVIWMEYYTDCNAYKS